MLFGLCAPSLPLYCLACPCISMQDLRASKNAFRSEVQSLSKELKRELRAERDAARAAARKWSLTSGILHTVLIIYALCDSAVAPASEYLQIKARERGWPPKGDDELEELVLGAFAGASVPLLVGLTDEIEPTDAGVHVRSPSILSRVAARLLGHPHQRHYWRGTRFEHGAGSLGCNSETASRGYTSPSSFSRMVSAVG